MDGFPGIGDKLAGRFRVVFGRGRGPCGAVFKALDLALDLPVAVKVFEPALFSSSFREQNLLRLYRARAYQDSNLVKIYEVLEDHGVQFITCQLMEGMSLSSVEDLHAESGELFTVSKIRAFLTRIMNGLLAIHRNGAIHGNLKPQNIFVLPDRLVLSDPYYLVEKALEEGEEIPVTDYYRGPEQLTDPSLEMRETDLYALALIIGEIITGNPVKPGIPLSLQMPRLTGRFDGLFLRSTDPDPYQRPHSLEEFGDKIVEALTRVETEGLWMRRYHETGSFRAIKLAKPAEPGRPGPEGGFGPAPLPMPEMPRPVEPIVIPTTAPAVTPAPAPEPVTAPIPVSIPEPVAPPRPAAPPRPVVQVETVAPKRTEPIGFEPLPAPAPRAVATTPAVPAARADVDAVAAIQAAAAPAPSPAVAEIERIVVPPAPRPAPAAEVERVATTPAPRAVEPAPAPPVPVKPPAPPPEAMVEEVSAGEVEEVVEAEDEGVQVAEVVADEEVLEGIDFIQEESQVPDSAPMEISPPLPAEAMDEDEDDIYEAQTLEMSPEQARHEIGAAFTQSTPPIPDWRPAGEAPSEDQETVRAPLPSWQQETAPTSMPPSTLPPQALAPPTQPKYEMERTQALPPEPPPQRKPVKEKSGLFKRPATAASIPEPPPDAARPQPAPMAPLERVAHEKPAPSPSRGSPTKVFLALFALFVVVGGAGVLLYLKFAGTDSGTTDGADTAPVVAAQDTRPARDVPKVEKEVVLPPVVVRDAAVQPDAATVAVVPPGPTGPKPPVAPPPKPKTLSELLKCPDGMAKVVLDPGAPMGADPATVAYCIDAWEYPGKGRKPRTGVGAGAGKAACKEEGKHLCTGAEWLRACGEAFPYGKDFDPDACNVSGKVGEAGAYKGCKTPEGVYDMAGNASEWTSDGVLRGGDAGGGKGSNCGARTKRFMPGPTNGFRCCTEAVKP